MNLRTGFRQTLLLMAVIVAFSQRMSAYSLGGVFPIQESTITAGEYTLQQLIGQQAVQMAAVNAEQVPISLEFKEMDNWNRKYYNYLSDASYVINSLQAGTTIYTKAFECFRNLVDLGKAIKENPQGVVSTAALNNLYVETAVKFVKVFRTLNNVLKKGGKQSMLNGADRCRLLWQISGELDELKTSINRIAISVRYYSIIDVWWNATLQYGIYDHKQVADYCYNKWKSNLFRHRWN